LPTSSPRTLQTEQERLQALLVEVRGVLQAGEQTSESVGTTVAALDTFVARFKPQDVQTRSPSRAGRRFDINDYAQTARDLGATAQNVARRLLVQLDSSSAWRSKRLGRHERKCGLCRNDCRSRLYLARPDC
jgi:hypothetical protein